MPFTGITFELGQIQLTEYDANDVLRAQPDGLGAAPRVATQQTHHLGGFAHRPSDPDTGPNGEILEGRGGLALIGRDGTDRIVFPLGDPRNLVKLSILKKGESMMYGPAANMVRCHLDGSVTCFTTDDGTLNGKSVYSQVRPDGFLFVAPWGRLTFDANGFHMLHSSGARLDAGAIGGLPSPLDQLGSYFKIAAASVQIEAAILALGTAAGASDPAARSTPVGAAFVAIAAALTSIQAALVAMVPGLVPGAATGASVAVTASGAFVVAFTSGVPALNVAIASNTTIT